MSRIAPVADQSASPQAAELFAAIKSKVGAVPNLYRVTANNPAVLGALLGLGEALGGGAFDPKTREAIALAVAGANDCDYCASAHTAISKGLKVDQAEIDQRLAGTSADPRLAAILKFAVAVTDKKGFATDDDLAAARDAGLSEADIIETVANVVANIFTNYLNHVAETEIDFPVVKARA
ncbi:MAG: carboxymuconolactone decarboxylase family protein [Pseudomonadota bacterium]